MNFVTYYHSPIGKVQLTSDGSCLTELRIEKQFGFNDYQSDTCQNNHLPIFSQTKKWLDDYFNKKQPAINALPLAPIGSSFSHIVWDILENIPYGKLMTYGEIAQIVAQKTGKEKMSAQAIGQAVGHNPISIIIPCHRVIGTNGNLTGYAGGLDIKIKLLKIENVDMTKLRSPKHK